MSTAQIQEVLSFWFAERELDEPNIDSRMACWFGCEDAFDSELKNWKRASSDSSKILKKGFD